MTTRLIQAWFRRLFFAFLLLGLLAAGAGYWGARMLRDRVVQSLGPNSEVGAVVLHWNSVAIEKLRIKAPPGWPATDALRAERVVVYPDIRGLLDSRIRIDAVEIEHAYLSALRTPDGKLRVVPGLALGSGEAQTATPLPVEIGEIEMRDAAIEFLDASIRQPPLRIRLDPVHARVGKISLPDLKGRSSIAIEGILQGPQADGTISVSGWLEPSSRDLDISTRLKGVDLVALEPYLVKAAKTHIKHGTLDLKVDSTVKNRQLHAPGVVTLNHLQLGDGEDWLGVPRKAVVGLMRDRDEKIEVRFELNGDLNDPKFHLNESIAARFAVGLAETVGVSLEGIITGTASLGQKSVEAVGGTFRKLFGESRPANQAVHRK